MSGNKTMMNILNKYNEYIVKNMELDEDDVKNAFDKFVKDNKKEINKKEKKPKDKNAPKRATTPYMAFCAETRPKLKKDGLDFAATASKLGEMWGKLTDKQKQKFVDIAEKDKKRYQEEMANYTPPEGNEADVEEKKGSGKGKRGKSGYQLFCAEMRPAIKKENPEISFKDMNKELGGMWAKVSKTEKDEWNNKAKGDGEAKMPAKKTAKKASKKQEEEVELDEDEDEVEVEDEVEDVDEDVDEDDDEDETVDYGKKTLSELKEIAKEKKIKGYAKMKKEELIEAIENA
jgi:structure-specific recognition protein 1